MLIKPPPINGYTGEVDVVTHEDDWDLPNLLEIKRAEARERAIEESKCNICGFTPNMCRCTIEDAYKEDTRLKVKKLIRREVIN